MKYCMSVWYRGHENRFNSYTCAISHLSGNLVWLVFCNLELEISFIIKKFDTIMSGTLDAKYKPIGNTVITGIIMV